MRGFAIDSLMHSPVMVLKMGLYLICLFKLYFFILVLVGHRSLRPSGLSLKQYFKKKCIPLIADVTMAQAITLLFGLLLVFPGFYKLIKYSFVPYVVLDREEAGRNSLKTSSQLIKGPAAFGIVLLTFLLFLPIQVLPDLVKVSSLPMAMVFATAVILSIVAQHCFYLALYKKFAAQQP